MHWYKRDPNAAIVGMTPLTLEECGAYNLILDHIYAGDGDLTADDDSIARLLHVHQRTWKRLKSALVAKGKIWEKDGKILAKRVEKTLKESREFAEKQSKNAAKRWQKPENTSENNGASMPSVAMPPGNAPTTTTTTTTRKKEPDAANAAEFEEFWKSKPGRKGANPKHPARLSFYRAVESGADAKQINAAAKRWARECVEISDGDRKFIPQAVVWLNQRRFEDYHHDPGGEEKYKIDFALMRSNGFEQIDGKWVKVSDAGQTGNN